MSTTRQTLADAKAAQSAGQLARAEELFRQAAADDGGNFEARYLHGMVCHQLGRRPDAIASLSAAIQLKPEFAAAHNHLGAVLAEEGRIDRAIECFRRAGQLDPGSHDAAINLRRAQAVKAVDEGIALAQQGRMDEAAACFIRALEWMPDHVDAHNNYGYVLQAQGKQRDAIPHFRKAIDLDANYVPAYINLGSCLEGTGQPAEAVACLQRAAALQPDNAEVHNNLGVAFYSLGQPDEAMASYQRALKLIPDHPRARLNRALALLLRGDFERGWQEFEWRKPRTASAGEVSRLPRWTGEPLDGRTILLQSEEGLGDTIQFVRYAQLLNQRGATVVVECPSVLKGLLATARGADRVITSPEPIGHVNLAVPMLSVGGIVGTALDSIPANVPYLAPDTASVNKWRVELAVYKGLKVGIAWQGNPTHKSDLYRSIPLAHFSGLARVPGVQLFSLQMGPGRDQLANFGGQRSIIDLGNHLGDFHNTAAAVRNLDLVITCDSAPAHLAGALGVPVWVALAVTPDWRWLLDRSDSPWYPTARLFRQTRQGDWKEVFGRIERELKRLVAAAPEQAP